MVSEFEFDNPFDLECLGNPLGQHHVCGPDHDRGNRLGFLTYAPDRRMSVLIVKENRSKPIDPAKPTEQERTELHKSVIAYGGSFIAAARRHRNQANQGQTRIVCN